MMKRKYSAIASPSELSSTASDLRVFTKRNAFGANPNLCLANAGFLGQLPAEILCQTFSFLPLADIGNVALASNALRMFVADWINSKGCLKRITELPEPDEGLLSVMKVSDALKHLSDPSQPAYRFSILCKRLTCLLATGDRIQFAFKMFHRVLSYQLENAPDQDQRSKDWSTTLFITQYCGMIHAFTRGWDESEFASLIKVLDARFDIGEKLKSFLAQNNRDDVCVASEMRIRLLLRSLTWDFAGKDYGHKAVWLLSILRRFVGNNPRSQALVFFLLFGPPCQDSTGHYDRPEDMTPFQRLVMNEMNNHTDWQFLVDAVPENFHEGRSMFYTLSQAICSCTMAADPWKNEMMVKVLDELILLPSPWKKDNVAGFLLFCSETLILDYLKSKLDRKSPKEVLAVAELLVHMIALSYRFDNDFLPDRGIGKIFNAICVYPEPVHERPLLLESITNTLVSEMESPSLEVEEEEMQEVFKGIGNFIMKRAYETVKDGKAPDVHAAKVDNDTDVEMEE